MAEKGNGASQSSQAPETEGLSMEKRLLLAFLLMMAVLFLTPYFYKPAAPPPPSKPPAAKQAQPAKAPVPPAKTTQEVEVTPVPGQIAAKEEEIHVIDTDLYRIVFSNRGGVVKSWLLKNFKDSDSKPVELVNDLAASKTGFPFSLAFGDQKPTVDLNRVLYAPRPAADGTGIDFEFSNGQVFSRKSFDFRKDSYLSQVSFEVIQEGKTIPSLLVWRGGFGDRQVPGAAAKQHSVYFNLADNKLVVQEAKAAKEGPVSAVGRYSFAGIEDAYFAAVVLPLGESSVELRTYSDTVSGVAGAGEEPHVGAGVGGGERNRFSLFVGPKDMDVLRKVNPKLEQLVDFGWFAFLAKPLFLAVNWMNDRFVHNYGWAIVVVTIIINFLLLPLKYTSLKSMKKMQMLQPQIAAINERYKGIGIRDPRKAEQNQQVMELYKKHGVNPMGGCVPMLLQIPFFIAFYKVLTVAIEMRGASWLWVTDLSQPEHLPIRILPVAMIISQFVMQKMTPTTTADPAQQKMMLLMPLVLGFMFYGVSSGLVLYWLTGNLVGIVQQLFFNRITPTPVVAQPAPVKKKKRNSRK